MYRRVSCDWFLSDGAHPRIRLDAPQTVEAALLNAGVLHTDADFEARMADEWIFRRVWTYRTEFALPVSGERVFLRLTGLNGHWRVYLNGEEAACGQTRETELEATGRLSASNCLTIEFNRDTSELLRPVIGYEGALSWKCTGTAAIMGLSVLTAEDGSTNVFTALDVHREVNAALSVRMICAGETQETVFDEALPAGYTPLLKKGLPALTACEAQQIVAAVSVDGIESDSRVLSVFPPDGNVALRGFVCEREAVMADAEQAGANAVFTENEEVSAAYSLFAARHYLSAVPLGDLTPVYAPEALTGYEHLLQIAGSEETLNSEAVWFLTGTKRDCLDGALSRVPSGDLEEAIRLSRYEQALSLRRAASAARLKNKPFALAGVRDGFAAPVSHGIFDATEKGRPAYYALMEAWQEEYAFAVCPQVIPTDGVISAEIYCVSDMSDLRGASVRTVAYAPDGTELTSTSFPAGKGNVGRMPLKIPNGGVLILRTELMRSGMALTVSDEVLRLPGIAAEELPRTQLLLDDGKVSNVGRFAAIGVCVPSAGYFGCLLPGEYVPTEDTDPDQAEGLNLY